MEDFQLDIVVGKGASAQSIRIDLARFTLVGATTRMGKVTAPLRDRFGIADKLDYYQPDELEQILGRAAGILDADLTPEGAEVIGTRSRGTPRIAIRLLARVRDYAVARAGGVVDRETAEAASGGVRGRPARARQGGPRHPRGARGPLLRSPGRAVHAGHGGVGGTGDGGRRLRALSPADRDAATNPPRAGSPPRRHGTTSG